MKKTKLGQDLISGLNEAIAYKRGEKTLRSKDVEIPDAPPVWSNRDIARLRIEKLHVSQSIFASYIGVSPAALQAWEQGIKHPSGAARRLLQLLDNAPLAIIPMLFQIQGTRKKGRI